MRINPTKGIPISTDYCINYEVIDDKFFMGKKCKYHRLRKRGKRSKQFSPSGTHYEYCKYLKKALRVGDCVKDCGIGE